MRYLQIVILSIVSLSAWCQTTIGGSFNMPSSGSSDDTPCVVTGTRNTIRSLATSSSLEMDCVYVITGFNRGCIQAEEIVLRPSANNAFSMDVDIKHTSDSDYWEARYDINTNRIVEVHDNLGNKVNGRYGNEVDRFPWGRTNVWGNTIDNADVYFDCTTSANINRNTWAGYAYSDLRAIGGTFEHNTIQAYGRVYLNNATGVDMRRNTFKDLCYAYFNGQSNIFHRQNTYGSNSYIRKFGGGRWTLYSSIIAKGDIRHYNGTAYNDQVNLYTGARLYQRETGTQDVRNCTFQDLSYVDLQARGGTTRLWRINQNSTSYFYTRTGVTGGNRYFYSSNIHSQSYIDHRSGSANIYFYNNDLSSTAYHRYDNANGNLRIYNNSWDSRAEFRINNITGNHTLYYNKLSAYNSRIYLYGGATGSNIQQSTFSAHGRLDINGGNPRVNYSSSEDLGVYILTNYTGTVQRSKLMSDSYLRLNGTGNIYSFTLGTSFDFRSTNLNHSYVTGFGNITHTAGASNNNRGNFHNLINNLQ